MHGPGREPVGRFVWRRCNDSPGFYALQVVTEFNASDPGQDDDGAITLSVEIEDLRQFISSRQSPQNLNVLSSGGLVGENQSNTQLPRYRIIK